MYEAPENPAAPAAAPGQRPGRPIDGQRLARAFTWGKWAVIAAIGAGIALGQLLKPYATRYSSTVQIVWEPATPQPGVDPRTDFRNFKAFVDSILSPSNLSVIRRRLGKKPTAAEIKGRYAIVFEKESSLVVITATGSSAKDAKKHADLLVEVLDEQQRGLAGRGMREDVRALTQDAERARADVARARKAYDDFRATHQISDIA